jgi:hypothetical protein
MIKKDNPIKAPSFRLTHCGNFPNYSLGGVSLSKKNIIYLVSVGTEKFKDKWIERFVNFAKEIKPQKVLIVVADSLQRFNIEIDKNLSEIEALQESTNRGQQWVKKYRPYFSTLEVNHEFIFWEKLKEDEDYRKYFKEIMEWNKSDNFKQLILESSKVYTDRFNRNLYGNQAIEQSSKFLNEECAVLRVLAKDINTIGIFYPGPSLKIFDYIIDYANKSRPHDSFFYTELFPTKIKKKRKQSDNPLNLLEQLPFFKCRKLSIETDESEKERLRSLKLCY